MLRKQRAEKRSHTKYPTRATKGRKRMEDKTKNKEQMTTN